MRLRQGGGPPRPVRELAQESARETAQPSWLFGAAVVASALVTGGVALFIHVHSATSAAKNVGNVFQMAAAMVATFACWRAAGRGGPEHRAWLLLSAGMLTWSVAAVGWTWIGVTRDHAYPFPYITDLGFIAYAIPAGAGLLAFPREPQLTVSWFRGLMDALVIASSALFVSWATVLGSVVDSSATGLGRVTALAYPIADVLMVSLVLVLGLRRPAEARLPWLFLGAGLFVLSVTDSTFVSLVNDGAATIGTGYQVGWTACFLLIALATITPKRGDEHGVRHFTIVRELLPYAPVVAAIVVAATRDVPISRNEPFLFWNGVLVLVVVIIHQVMVAYEKTSLASGLETTVATRTEELVRARNDALAASRSKSDFLATMSHEIRTPMNGVIGLTSLLIASDLDETQHRYASGVRGAGEALLVIIDDILDFSKLEAGKVELEEVDFDPQQLVEEVGVLLAAAASNKGLELVAYCDPALPSALRGDPGRLRQVLINLTSNAIKFTETGDVTLHARIADQNARQRSKSSAVEVVFEVRDTGIGINADQQVRLFEPFTQADATTTRRYGGTGLGLAICKRLATAMDGELSMSSEPGRGSAFTFTVPLAPAVGPATVLPDPLAGLRVLVVDDNDINRMVLSTHLDAWGLRPAAAIDGPSGLALARAAAVGGEPFDLAILDLCMPGMDGLELATALTSDPLLAETRSMILTSAGALAPDEAERAGIQEWARKPVRFSELLNALLRMVDPADLLPIQIAEVVAVAPARTSRGVALVVEDNATNQIVAQGVLSQLGFTVTVVGDGRQALEALTLQTYDVVLMDCHMPVMDGFEATAELRRREAGGRRTPVIAMTAGVLPEDRQRCFDAGMDDFVPKPVAIGVLDTVLARWEEDAHNPADSPADPAAPVAAPVLEAAATPLGDPDHDDQHAPNQQDPDPLDRDRLEFFRQLGPTDGWGLLPAVVGAFLDDLPTRLAALQDAARNGGGQRLTDAAHHLKGSAANVGAPAVAELCHQLETASGADLATRSDLMDRVETELDRAERALAATLPVSE